MAGDDAPDGLLGRLALTLFSGTLGTVAGVVVGAVALGIGFGIALVLVSPILYPATAGMVCYQPPGIPEWGMAFAAWYYDLFDGLYPIGCG